MCPAFKGCAQKFDNSFPNSVCQVVRKVKIVMCANTCADRNVKRCRILSPNGPDFVARRPKRKRAASSFSRINGPDIARYQASKNRRE